MTSREDIAEGKWAVVSYDMSTAKDNALAENGFELYYLPGDYNSDK